MPTIELLRVVRGGEHVHSVPLGDAALEVGSHPACDVTLHGNSIPPRGWLVVPASGTVQVYDLRRSPALRHRAILAVDHAMPIGDGYHMVRERVPRLPRTSEATDLLRVAPGVTRPIALVQGRGSESKTVSLVDGPFSMGSSKKCSLCIPDRAVSALHCRFEPFGHGVVLRDLGSTNGTWVDGVRVHKGAIRPGCTIRIGRTEFHAVGGSVAEVGTPGPVAVSGGMLRVLADVDRFSQVRWPALIRGETGVGKELVARALHDRGVRSAGPFVALNGGGLPPQLIESELFGHERGAFTGASQVHRGAFEQATGGTLFLDEVAELPAPVQTRLLRVLESWQVRRVGSEIARKVDVRLVCATHRDLRAMVQRGEFRADLYYRIHRLVIEVPPLRQRSQDIQALARHFLSTMAAEVGHKHLSREAEAHLRGHPWPGNVRELRNALELAAVTTSEALIDVDAIDRALRCVSDVPVSHSVEFLREALADHGGNFAAAARAVGLPRSTLRDRLKGGAGRVVSP